MTRDDVAFWAALIGLACWGVCFWWMRRIANNQRALLDELCEQGRRIEKLSKAEHDLIKEVHPQVGEIKDSVEKVKAAVRNDASN